MTFPGVPDRAVVLQLETGSISPLWWNPPTVLFIYLCLYSNISNLLSKQRFVPLAEVASPQSALAARTQGAAVCCILTLLVHSHMNVFSTGRLLCWIFCQQTFLFGLKLCNTMATCFALCCFRVYLFILFRLCPWQTVAINWMDCFSDCEAPEQLHGWQGQKSFHWGVTWQKFCFARTIPLIPNFGQSVLRCFIHEATQMETIPK